MLENIKLGYSFGYLIENDNKKNIKLDFNNNDNILDSGLIIGVYSNNEILKAYFLGNNEITDKYNKGETLNIFFKKDNFSIDNNIFTYSDLLIKINNDDVFLAINDFVFSLKKSFRNLLIEYNLLVETTDNNFHLTLFNDNLYLKDDNYKFIHELDLIDNHLIINTSIEDSFIYCKDFKKQILIRDCYLVTRYDKTSENNILATVYLEYLSENNMKFTLGYTDMKDFN